MRNIGGITSASPSMMISAKRMIFFWFHVPLVLGCRHQWYPRYSPVVYFAMSIKMRIKHSLSNEPFICSTRHTQYALKSSFTLSLFTENYKKKVRNIQIKKHGWENRYRCVCVCVCVMSRKYTFKNQGIDLCKGRLEARRTDESLLDIYQSC